MAPHVRDNILFCIADTGVDAAHPDLGPPNILSGCSNVTNSTWCKYSWNTDSQGHGTHISGTIGAVRNGFGMVGGAGGLGIRLRMHNVFGNSEGFEETELVNTWQDCLEQLDIMKQTNPNAKAVVSMSVGGAGNPVAVIESYANLFYARGDILFFAAAGNDANAVPNYPAAYTSVISVAALDWNNNVASFSTYNSDVELAAAGLLVISTLAPVMAASSGAPNPDQPLLTLSPALPEEWTLPETATVYGSGTGRVQAPLVNCGMGFSPCTNATGKICLIQRGSTYFCEKVINCVAGGGVGAVIFNKDQELVCTALAANLIGACANSTAFPPTVGLARGQGTALLAMMNAGQEVSGAPRSCP